MKWVFFNFVAICCFCNLAKGQSLVNGLVFAQSSRKPVDKVDVLNLTNKEQVMSNAKGEFAIKATVNDILVFSMPGYKSDTVLLINPKPLRRYLELDIKTLNTVNVNAASLREQYAQTFNKANAVFLKQGRGFLFYPSGYFSREGKNARRLKRMIKHDELEIPINQRFNVKTVTAILPLKQPELDAFMLMYRPTLKFVKRADVDDFKFYLFNAYNQFKMLPVEKRILPSLK